MIENEAPAALSLAEAGAEAFPPMPDAPARRRAARVRPAPRGRPAPRASISARRRSKSRPDRRLREDSRATSTCHGEFPPDAIPPPEMSLSVLSDLRPLGQIHESFIVAAGRDGLWIIDQHVAHERILFEQVLQAARRRPRGDAAAADAADRAAHARAADRLRAHRRRAARLGLRNRAVRQPHHRGQGRAGGRAARRIWRRSSSRSWRSPKANCAAPRSTICAAASAPPSPAARPSRSTPAWTPPRWNGCCARWRPPIAP